jgi:glyoxylase-like metal-dependent hydrolase (beta-lactamase superfamily II)
MSEATITPEELQRRLDAGEPVTVLDTRNRDEVEAWAIGGQSVERHHVPYAKFLSAKVTGGAADLLPEDVVEPVVAVCPRGEASDEVAELLRGEGVDAVNLAGGMEGWARVYTARELPAEATDDATVVQYRRPSSGCLAYLVVSGASGNEGREAAVVDPLRAFADRYAEDARERGAEPVYAVDTHVHADHVSGVREVADLTGATPVVAAKAVERGVTFDVETVVDGDRLDVGGTGVEVHETPGHTTGMVSLRVGDTLLTGDTLFAPGVPRPDLQAGDEGAPEYARELHRTLTERFERFGDDVLIAPGHFTPGTPPAEDGTYTAQLGDLRGSLSVFSLDREAFVDRVLADMPPRPANFETIVATNLGRETLSDEDAFEAELGPNNCAAAAD